MMPAFVVAIGPLPPPIHGLSKNTVIITDLLRGRCELHVVNTSAGTLRRSPSYYAKRGVRELRGTWELLCGMTAPERRVYLPANAKGGLFYTLLHAALARVAKYKIFVHHRSFHYIEHPSLLMRAVVRLAGSDAVHVFLCDVMRDGFERTYGAIRNRKVVSNAVFIRENLALKRTVPPDGVIRIGHMSNLSFEKGLFDFLDLLRALRRSGVRFQAVLAGPAESTSVSAAIRAAQDEFGTTLDYRNAVYDEAKTAFFQEIDVFIFATRSEAQPNVVFEALSLGVPVIAFGRGCIASDLPEVCGKVIPVDSDFVTAAHARIVSWVSDPASLRASSAEAREQARRACEASEAAFEEMLDAIAGVSPSR